MTKPADDDPLVQLNVRVRKSQFEALDARRRRVGISRDEWARRVFTWALTNPDKCPVYPEPKGKRSA